MCEARSAQSIRLRFKTRIATICYNVGSAATGSPTSTFSQGFTTARAGDEDAGLGGYDGGRNGGTYFFDPSGYVASRPRLRVLHPHGRRLLRRIDVGDLSGGSTSLEDCAPADYARPDGGDGRAVGAYFFYESSGHCNCPRDDCELGYENENAGGDRIGQLYRSGCGDGACDSIHVHYGEACSSAHGEAHGCPIVNVPREIGITIFGAATTCAGESAGGASARRT